MVNEKKNSKKSKNQPITEVELVFTDREKLLDFPWPWADKSIKEFKCSEIFQYIPANVRQKFMEELYRVLDDDGRATILTSYYSSGSAIADYEVEWPPICEQSFLFFNKSWREANNLMKPMNCDFDFVYGYAWTPEVASRTPEVQADFIKYRLNAAHKLQVVLTKVKK